VIPVVADLSRTRPIARGLEAVAVKGIKAKNQIIIGNKKELR
jgi:hypothetical protein